MFLALHENFKMVSALLGSIPLLSCQDSLQKKLPLTHKFCSHDGKQKFKKTLYSLALHSTLSLCSDTQVRIATYNMNEKCPKLLLCEAVHTLPLQKAHGYRNLCDTDSGVRN